jgi:predicted phage-related endonuclease
MIADREAWLEERRKGIGGSDAAARRMCGSGRRTATTADAGRMI